MITNWPAYSPDLNPIEHIWWHLKAGRAILQGNGIPTQDTYTIAAAGHEWIDLHWLFQTAAACVYDHGGMEALTIAGAATAVLAVAAGILGSSSRAVAPFIVVLWFPALLVMSSRFFVRPEIISLACLAAYSWVLRCAENKPTALWLLVPIQILWANVQGLFCFGPFLLCCWLIDRWWHALPERRDSLRMDTAAPTISVLLACFVNPYGWRGAVFPLTLARTMFIDGSFYREHIGELASPSLHAIVILFARDVAERERCASEHRPGQRKHRNADQNVDAGQGIGGDREGIAMRVTVKQRMRTSRHDTLRVELDASPADNVRRLAKAKGVEPGAITVLVLDRPRHADIITGVRSTGAAVRLITDGDVAGVIHCADPDNTGVDMYIGTGGAPEGVLAAAALRCIGGQMQCRLILDSDEKRERAHKMGVTDPKMIYGIEDMVRGDCLFAATGVTTGSLLSGVKFRKNVIETETVVMRSVTGTVRYIKAEHRQLDKFHLD
jgi:hypothetical protein